MITKTVFCINGNNWNKFKFVYTLALIYRYNKGRFELKPCISFINKVKVTLFEVWQGENLKGLFSRLTNIGS